MTEPIEKLIERSSLGTPEAVWLRKSVPEEVARRVVARSRSLVTEHPYRPNCPRCAVPVIRTQHSRGVIAVYPCLCWLPARRTTACGSRRDVVTAKVGNCG